MNKKAQIEDILLFFALVIIIFSAFIYYFYFKTGKVPVLKPRKEIKPAEKSVIPPGIFFPKKEKLPFLNIMKVSEASVFKINLGTTTKPNKNLETSIKHKYKNLNYLETNEVEFELEGKNLKNPNEKIHFAYLLIPIENNWKVLKSNKLKITLPKKPQIYILLVSSLNEKNEYDPSPYVLIFSVNVSKYFNDIKITSLQNRNIIRIKNFSQNTINITNWKIVSSLGNFVIPQGVEFVEPSGNYIKKDIVLNPGEEVKIIASSSPLGFSFKINKCFAYFLKSKPSIKKFLDNIPNICDKFSKEELLELRKGKYSLNCILVLEKAGCTGIQEKDYTLIKNDISCLNLINARFNYQSCYEKNKNNIDFIQKNWYIFIPTNFFYYPRYEEIRLLDENGLLVNKYIIY